jgi:methylglutaconyl-CoA hydratase
MTLLKKYAEGVCYLKLNRPDKKNAMNKTMLTELNRFLAETAESKQFRVLVISGSEGYFSSGADLEWMQQGSDQTFEENIQDANLFNELYFALANYPKPVIVKVDNGANGGAIGLLACADFVFTSPDASFSFGEVTLGLIPATVAPYIIKKTGIAVARELLLGGMPFSGEKAAQINLVQQLFPAETLNIKTKEFASKLAKNSPSAMKQTKILLNRLGDSIVSVNSELQEFCASLIASARCSSEGREGVSAFLEKRKPSYNDKT